MEFQNPEAEADIRSFLRSLPFARTAGTSVVRVHPGTVTLEAGLSEVHEAAPGTIAASAVGAIGDMAAICSMISCLPKGWATATLDFTVKMCGPARGGLARAVEQVLQSGKTTSVARTEIS